MKTTLLLMTMTLLGLFSGCKTTGGNAKTPRQPAPTMPQGELVEVDYHYQGMAMEMIGSPRLQRQTDGRALLSFELYGQERQFEVSDTLLAAARAIIEEERMYEYGVSYDLVMDGAMILDGYSWSFGATFLAADSTQVRLSSHGSNAEPDGDGLNRLRRLLTDAAMPFARQEMEQEQGR